MTDDASTERMKPAMSSRIRGRRPVTLIALGMLTLLSLGAALVAARVTGPNGPWLWYYDLPKIYYPLAVFAHQAATALRFPLWNDDLGLGFPMYAEGQIGAFYPPNLLIFRLDPLVALDVTRTAHLTLAGVGAGLIGRRLSGSWLGASVAAVGTVLSDGIVGKLEWTDVVGAYGWMPWVFLPLVRRPRPSRLGLVGAGVAWGIQGLDSHPMFWAMTGLCAIVILLTIAPRRQTLPRVAGFASLGLAVAAVQVIPLLTLWALSSRAAGLPAWDVFSNSATILDPLLPGFAGAFVQYQGGAWALSTQWYPGGVWALHEAGMYVGLPLLGLAGAGAAARRARPLIAVTSVMVALAVVGALQPSFWLSAPILNALRHPTRAYLFVGLMLSLLASIGISRATRERDVGALVRAAALILGSIALYGGLLGLIVAKPSVFDEIGQRLLGVPAGNVVAIRTGAVATLTAVYPLIPEIALGLLALLLIWVAQARRRHSLIVRVGLVVTAAAPLFAFSPAANQIAPINAFSQVDRPYVRAVLATKPARFLALVDPSAYYDGYPNQLASLSVNELGMFSSLNLAATDGLIASIWSSQPDPTRVNTDIARAVGVDVVAAFESRPCPGVAATGAGDDVSICRLAGVQVPYWIPRNSAGHIVVSQSNSIAAAFLSARGATPVDYAVDASAIVASSVPATLEERSDQTARITVDAPSDGWVYIDRAWWPGWQVTVDGTLTSPGRALAGQLVPVSAGTHVIREQLVPWDAFVGLAVGLLGLLIALIWLRFGPNREPAEDRRQAARDSRAALARTDLPVPASTVERVAMASRSGSVVAVASGGGLSLARVKARLATTTPRQPAVARSLEREAATAPPRATGDGVDWEIGGRRPLALLAIAFAMLLLSAYLPPLAIVAAWPFLTVIPGWWLVARVAPTLSPPGRLGAGIVVSVFLASHLINVLANVIGFGRPAIIAATGILIVATWALATRPLPVLTDPPRVSIEGARRAIVRYRTAWLLAGGTFFVVLTVLGLSAWHLTPAGWVSGGWNWSDFLIHVSIGNSIINGNFPPQIPYYSGAPLTYHWFADFHGAILAAIAEVPIIPVFIASSAVMAGALALVVWELARRLTLNRRAAAIAVIIAVFAGGLGWIRLVLDINHGQGTLLELLTKNPYDNSWASDWPFFRIASVLGTGLLTHRATAFGLPGLVAVVLLAHASIGRRPAGMLLAGILAALLAPFQFFFFPATYLIVGFMFLARRVWRWGRFIRDGFLFGVPVVLALPFVGGAVVLQAQRGAFHLVLGWSEARISEGGPAAAFFYATNLGLPVALALVALIWPRRFVARPFLAVWLLALFLVPNIVVVSAVPFDMNKYFQVMWIAVAILAAWLMRRWPRPIIAVVLAISVISPALVATWDVLDQSVALSVDQERVAEWIQANTPDRSIFVTDAFINSPVDFAGRLRITGFGPYVANLGYDPDPRARDVNSVYCHGDTAAAATMARYGATYVLSAGGVLDCGGGQPTDFDHSARFALLFRSGRTSVWALRP